MSRLEGYAAPARYGTPPWRTPEQEAERARRFEALHAELRHLGAGEPPPPLGVTVLVNRAARVQPELFKRGENEA